MANSREVREGTQVQGVDEIIVYTIDVSAWSSSPTSPAVVVKDMSASALDVTSTVMPSGSPSVGGTIITLPPLKLLTISHRYRVEVKFVSGTQTLEVYFFVEAEL